MFGKKKGKDKEKKKGESNLQQISSNRILVRVYKDFGSNTQILKAEYDALEKRDSFNNLISVNTDFSHNQDTDFTIDDVYREMQIILEFKNKGKQDKLEILQKKIDYQDRLIKYLEKYPRLNAVYNYCDEDLKSRDYKILKNHIQNHEGEGAYFTIENGLRVYSFLACDGYLAPIWHGIDRYTQYPDHTRKLKITVQEDMRMRQEIEEYNKNKKIGNIIAWGLVITVILFGLNVYAGFKLYDKHSTLDDKIHESAYRCAELTQKLNEAYGIVITEKFIPQEQKPQAEPQELTPKTAK